MRFRTRREPLRFKRRSRRCCLRQGHSFFSRVAALAIKKQQEKKTVRCAACREAQQVSGLMHGNLGNCRQGSLFIPFIMEKPHGQSSLQASFNKVVYKSDGADIKTLHFKGPVWFTIHLVKILYTTGNVKAASNSPGWENNTAFPPFLWLQQLWWKITTIPKCALMSERAESPPHGSHGCM